MQVITISVEAYRLLINKIDSIAEFVQDNPNLILENKWLDIQEACVTLKISKRTLQKLRDHRILPFSKIGGKIYFKAADIQDLLQKNYHSINNK